jgi:hypothetical protein
MRDLKGVVPELTLLTGLATLLMLPQQYKWQLQNQLQKHKYNTNTHKRITKQKTAHKTTIAETTK